MNFIQHEYMKFKTQEEAESYLQAQSFNPYISYSNPFQLNAVEDPDVWYINVTYWPPD